ncbi:Rv3654c family TadE-like protein [Streptomyces jumonjinensis]|uniref:Rv3654c family TadE-like protein n=1 Tax=Streptomyces jumonjinensis TaxID=1945 RepID=UPI00379D0743
MVNGVFGALRAPGAALSALPVTGRDRGSATVWAALAATVLCLVFAAVLAMGQVVAVRHRAAGAADLAALAAAGHALPSPAAACGKAAEVARAQGAEVVRCAVRGEIAEVTARVRFGPYAPEIRSRAGPAEAVGVPPDAMGPEAPAMRRGPATADRLSAGDRPGAGRRPEAGGRGGERAPPWRGGEGADPRR